MALELGLGRPDDARRLESAVESALAHADEIDAYEQRTTGRVDTLAASAAVL